MTQAQKDYDKFLETPFWKSMSIEVIKNQMMEQAANLKPSDIKVVLNQPFTENAG